MTGAMFRAMLLTLWNDRGALVMAFVLPVLFFLVMAEIFSSASGGPIRLRVAFADEVNTELSGRLLYALRSSPSLEVAGADDLDAAGVEKLVAKGTADVGVVLSAEGRSLADISGLGPAPIVIISDPVRSMTVPMLSGQIQKAYFEALPDVALGSVMQVIEDQFIELDEEQRAELDAGLEELGAESRDGLQSGWSFGEMLKRRDVAGQSAATNHVAYYAGAVAFLFLLFSCMQGAISLTEERTSGILERIMAGPGGMAVLVNGKFLFLLVQGFVQMAVIFLAAWLIYDVNVPAHLGSWVAITLFACSAAAALSLAVAAVCRTPEQARNVWTVIVLIASVLGGSMVPRFFMPLWLRDLGWFTPNTWVLEAYSAVFWRDASLPEVWLPLVLLAGLSVISLLAAQWFAVKRARL
ncbi:MAG: ABC transporter permease [Gammaproteobacteria bacterium]